MTTVDEPLPQSPGIIDRVPSYVPELPSDGSEENEDSDEEASKMYMVDGVEKDNNDDSNPSSAVPSNTQFESVNPEAERLRQAILGGKIAELEHLLNKNDLLETELPYELTEDSETMTIGITPLALAGAVAESTVVKLLLDRNANVEAECPKIGGTSLHLAARHGSIGNVEMLLSRKITLNHADRKGSTALHLACRYGRVDVVNRLLDAGADISRRDMEGSTAFHYASIYRHVDVLKTLWARGPKAQIKETNIFLNTPLHLASINNNYESVKWLLSQGAAIDASARYENTPLHHACFEGHHEVVETLLDQGANPHKPNRSFTTPMLFACLAACPKTVDLLLENAASVTDLDASKHTCVHNVIRSERDFCHDHSSIINTMFGHGLDIDSFNQFGYTPLFLACRESKPKAIMCLLSLGANINKTHPQTQITPFMQACCMEDSEIVSLFLDRGADTGIRNNHGLSPFALACRFGRIKNVILLLEKGAKAGVRDCDGHSPLSTAATQGHIRVGLEVIRSPCYYPKDPANNPSFTETAKFAFVSEQLLLSGFEKGLYESRDVLQPVMHWAVANSRLELIDKCIDYQSSVLKWTRDGATWLHMAARHGHCEVFQRLISEVDVLAVADDGTTALHIAAERGLFDITNAIINRLKMVPDTSADGWGMVDAIIKRNHRNESPLTLCISQRHRQIENAFWEELRDFGTDNPRFLQLSPTNAEELIELLAQWERPGHEDVLRHLLQVWSDGVSDFELRDYTTLQLAVYHSQVAAVWWLLSKEGYATGDVVGTAQRMSAGRNPYLSSLITDLLLYPPPILEDVANPNDQQQTLRPILAISRNNAILTMEANIVDVYMDAKKIHVPSTKSTIHEVIYGQGPKFLMDTARSLNKRHLDVLKEKIEWSKRRHRKSMEVSADSEDDILGKHSVKRNPGELQLRWIHLPVNDLQLIKVSSPKYSSSQHSINPTLAPKDLVTRLSHESDLSEMHHRELMRFFDRSWSELAAGGATYYMKPQCVHSDQSGGNSASRPRGPSIWTALYVPYLQLGEYDSTAIVGKLDDHKGIPPNDEDTNKPSRGVAESLTFRSYRQITHHPMTLDQYYYPTIPDTTKRDNDQVLSKYIDQQQAQTRDKKVQHRKKVKRHQVGNTIDGTTEEPSDQMNQMAAKREILMVDQLWIWIIDGKTIVTATTEPSDADLRNSVLQRLLDSIVYGDARGQFERPRSVQSVMELVLGVATGFFIEKSVLTSKNIWKSPTEIFQESIRDVANQEITLFGNFLRDLKNEARERQRRSYASSHPSIRELPDNPYHIISDETELLDKIRDLRDELHILRSLAEDQEIVWKQAFKTDVLKGCFNYTHPCTPTEVIRNIDKMIMETETTHNSVNVLLELRQKQASIKEAEYGRLQANDTARQSNSVLVFTIITIIFLPLSFLSSLFALDISAFPHESGDVKYKSYWIFPILFGVTTVVSIPSILFAWKVNDIRDWFRPSRAKLRENSTSSATQELHDTASHTLGGRKEEIASLFRRKTKGYDAGRDVEAVNPV